MQTPALTPAAAYVPPPDKPPRLSPLAFLGWLIAAAFLLASPFVAGGVLPLLVIILTGRA